MKKLLIGVLGILLGAGLLLAHGRKPWPVPEMAKKRRNPVAATPKSIKQGALLYLGNCLLCHGAKGDGNGPWQKKLPVEPADFTDEERMSAMADGEIFWKMSTGRDPMPSFSEKLTQEQRWYLVNYLRTFSKEESRSGEEKEH